MSEQLSFDRKKGFVALPVEIMDFDLTPGAFRTLAELCRMANSEGYCWPSLHQLSERLGRSRSAISGYIKELRETELVSTEEQKTANGYNYRLKYRVTFWQEWRASLRPQAGQPSERSVQPAKRLKESKNQSHINHSRTGEADAVNLLLKRWARCFAGAPYPLVRHHPSAELIAETTDAISGFDMPQRTSRAVIAAQLSRFWQSLGIEVSGNAVALQAETLGKSGFCDDELQQLLALMHRDWPSHWRKCPNPDAFRKLLKATGMTAQHSRYTLLTNHLKRWRHAEKVLQKV